MEVGWRLDGGWVCLLLIARGSWQGDAAPAAVTNGRRFGLRLGLGLRDGSRHGDDLGLAEVCEIRQQRIQGQPLVVLVLTAFVDDAETVTVECSWRPTFHCER